MAKMIPGSGSAGQVIVDVKLRSNYFEVYREHDGFTSDPVRCGSIDQLMVAVQDMARKVIANDKEDEDT